MLSTKRLVHRVLHFVASWWSSRLVVRFVLSKCFINCDTLELRLLRRLFTFDLFVMREVFQVFGVIVRVIRLRLGCGVELF